MLRDVNDSNNGIPNQILGQILSYVDCISVYYVNHTFIFHMQVYSFYYHINALSFGKLQITKNHKQVIRSSDK